MFKFRISTSCEKSHLLSLFFLIFFHFPLGVSPSSRLLHFTAPLFFLPALEVVSPCVGESLNWVLDSDGARFPFPLWFLAFPWLCMVSPMSLGPGVEALLSLVELPPSLFSVNLSTYFGKIASHEPINSLNALKCGQSSIGLLPSPKNASCLSPVCNSLRD